MQKAKVKRRAIAGDPWCRKRGILQGGLPEFEVVLMSAGRSSGRVSYAIDTVYLTWSIMRTTRQPVCSIGERRISELHAVPDILKLAIQGNYPLCWHNDDPKYIRYYRSPWLRCFWRSSELQFLRQVIPQGFHKSLAYCQHQRWMLDYGFNIRVWPSH